MIIFWPLGTDLLVNKIIRVSGWSQEDDGGEPGNARRTFRNKFYSNNFLQCPIRNLYIIIALFFLIIKMMWTNFGCWFSHLFIPSLLLFLTVFLVFRTQSVHERIVSLFYCNNNKSHSQCLVETNTGVFMGQWHFPKSTLVNPPRWSRQVWPIFQQMFESNITAVFKNCGQKYPTIN